VTKDSTRIGRDHLRVGLYREMFHEKGVRVIGINDGVDTDRGDDDFTPFRDIMSEWQARDTSRKVKSVLHAKAKNGKPLTNKVPYGFMKDPTDKDKWLVDQTAAEIVRRVFNLTVEGVGPYEIARLLHDERIERPSYYLAKNGIVNCPSWLEPDPYLWRGNTVATILARPEYAGHTINFRTKKSSFKAMKSKKASPDEWQVIEHTHEAVVPQETWDLAQKLRQTIRRTDTVGEANPLTGLVYCSDCGAKMYNKRNSCHTMRTSTITGKQYQRAPSDSYSCSTCTLSRQTYAKECTEHHIMTSAIRGIILDVLKRTTGYARDHEEEFAERIRESSALKQGETIKTHTRQIAKNERRISELDKVYRNLYEDKVNGRINVERFTLMSAGYELEQDELKGQNKALQAEIDMFNADSEKADKFIALVRRFTRFEELTNAMINEFVDKIVVHEGVWSEKTENYKGTRTQQVDVYLKYIADFNVPDSRTTEEIEAERVAEEKNERLRTQKRECERKRRERIRAEKAAETDEQNLPSELRKTA